MNRQLVTDWFTKQDLEVLVIAAEIGDLLEFKRQAYTHWAIYVGRREINGILVPCVIHRSSPSSTGGPNKLSLVSGSVSASITGENVGPVAVESMADVLCGDKVRINNHLDRKWAPFSAKEIVARAEKLMVSMNDTPDGKYDLLKNNCEHFVNRCRYGRQYSRQVLSGVIKLGATGLGVALTTARMGALVAGGPTAGVALGIAAAAVTVVPMVRRALSASQQASTVNN